MPPRGKLILLCGKMAAGKTTLAKRLARQHDAVLLSQDDFVESLYPGAIVDIATFVEYSTRIKRSLTPHIRALLLKGISVMLDFPGNTAGQRNWFRVLLEGTDADHELHFIDVPDDVCKAQLKERNRDYPQGTKWTTDAEFDAITAYFQPPAAEEGFNVVRHART